MATSEEEEFEFRRRAEAEAAPRAKPERPTILGTVGRALWNAPMDAAETVKGAMMMPVRSAEMQINAARHPIKTWEALSGMARGAGDVVGGMAQQFRDLSPPSMRGTAPPMDKTAAQSFEQNFTRDNLLRTVGDHPVGAALSLVPAARSVKLGEALARVPSPIAAAGRVLDAGATPAAERVRAAALAKVLTQQRATADAEAAAASRKAADVPLRAKMESAAGAQAAKGVGVSDIPEAQSLVAELSGRLNPNGPVATTPTTGQAAAYKAIIETLAPPKGPKPSLEMVQNLRRELAEAAYGGADPHGFGAISKIDKRDLVKRLHDIEDAYTGGASTPVRENYAAAMTAQEKAEELGKIKNKLVADAANLEELPAQQAAAKANSIVQSLVKRGLVSDAEYRDFLKLANEATTAQGKSAFRKRVALLGLAAAGVSATGATVGGHALGVLP